MRNQRPSLATPRKPRKPQPKKRKAKKAIPGYTPTASEEFILRMEEKYADKPPERPIDVRFQIGLCLSYETTKKYDPPDYAIQRWLNIAVSDATPKGGNNGRKSGRGTEAGSKPSPLANLPTGVFGYDDPGA